MVAIPFLLDSLSAGVGFIFYVAVCLFESLRDDSRVGKSERRRMTDRSGLKKRKSDKRSWANTFHLLGALAMFALSIAHAIVLAKSRGDALELNADPDVGSVLFGSLIWLVIFLSLIDVSSGAGLEQTVPFMLSQRKGLSEDKKNDAVEETQPLLAAEEGDTNKTKDRREEEDDDDKSVISSLSDDEGKPEEDMTDAQKEEKNQRLALRDRPWYQYIASFRIFLPFVRPRSFIQWFYLSVMILNTLVARAITVATPLMLGAVIDDLTHAHNSKTHEFAVWKVLAYVALRFASSSSGIYLIKQTVSYRLNIELHNTLLTHCYNHIMNLDATFHMSKSTPSTWQIMDRGQSVINLLQDVVFDHLPVVADLIIAMFVVSKFFGGYLCFVVATTMILLSWSNRITMSKKTKMRRYYVDLWRNWYTHMSESFMHWRTVSEFDKVSYEKKRHEDKTRAVTKINIQQRSFSIYLNAVQELVVTVGFGFVCVLAAMEIAAGRLEVGRFVVLITYWGQIMSPVTRLANFASDIAEQLVDAEKLMLLLEKKPKIVTPPNAPLFQFKGGAVKFEKCSFSYDGTRTVTKDVSFTAEPGQTIALVGETGGGKSTIFNLLFRFYDPTEGRVFVDGQDISKVNLDSYRTVLGLVPQDPVLFNSSILKNVRYSNLTATKDEVIAACQAAQFHDKVEKFPKKYLQKVGEMAQKLSGGEKQRLAIARAILKKPGILLLDEATSAVDSVTESKIQESLEQPAQGRTTFVIAHRLSTIQGADKILVIKGGEIVEAGSHQELLEHGNGAYKELWEAQLKLNAGRPKEKKDVKKSGAEEDLISLEESSSTSGQTQAHDEQKSDSASAKSLGDAKVDEAKDTRLTGVLTPPETREQSPKTGSVVDDDLQAVQKADVEVEEEKAQGEGDKAMVSGNKDDETSSTSTKGTHKSKDYGTL
ncbi:hypothetical protein LTR64_008109 [Lithohypha guttulata]|uniref:uncharacterized protein n=1 Tax=Lithohypha guttulata TaxID=1690604 RepID=UPI002DDF7CCF|nr:hypothetical protein LTR51_008021 [Lithohypha guttulata]